MNNEHRTLEEFMADRELQERYPRRYKPLGWSSNNQDVSYEIGLEPLESFHDWDGFDDPSDGPNLAKDWLLRLQANLDKLDESKGPVVIVREFSDGGGPSTFHFCSTRAEMDDEWRQRVNERLKSEREKVAAEKAQLEALKKKYGG